MFFTIQEVNVSAVTTYVFAAPQVNAGFEPSEWRFTATGDAAKDLFISFDGVHDHYRVNKGSGVESIVVRTAQAKVWIRSASGTGTTGVEVSANTTP